MPRLSWQLLSFVFSLFLLSSSSSAFAYQDIIESLKKPAVSFAARLANAAVEPVSEQQRQALLQSAQFLSEREKCEQAYHLRYLLMEGIQQPQQDDWQQLAKEASCANQWRQAVYANYHAYQLAENKKQQLTALAYLGHAMDKSWQYSDDKAIALLKVVLQYQSIGWIEKRVADYERQREAQNRLELDRTFSEIEGETASLCLDFNDSLLEPQDFNYADYVRFEPAFNAHFHLLSSDELCADGAAFGTEYRVTVLAGFKSETGLQTDKALTDNFMVGNKAPKVWFENRRYVMPRSGRGVPVNAVNIDKLDLELYRIDERNLSQTFVRDTFQRNLDEDDVNNIRNRIGHSVWKGQADLHRSDNQTRVTNLPIAQLAAPTPGVYVLTAEDANADAEHQWGYQVSAQWLLVSDLGISTYQGKHGLTVTLHSLQTAKLLPGIRLALYGRNNVSLAEATTDADGVASFSHSVMSGKGGQQPERIMAFANDGDFNFFNLDKAPYDLSDRGVAGRKMSAAMDVFAYTERGVYRPGEVVNLTALLRSDLGMAIDGLPLTLKLIRPDDQVSYEQVLHSAGTGGYSTQLEVSETAMSGRWKVHFYVDPKSSAIGETAFQVEAIVPPRIAVDIKQAPQFLLADSRVTFSGAARYLFGAPAVALETVARLTFRRDSEPFKAFKDYHFGPLATLDMPETIELDPVETNQQGAFELAAQLEALQGIAYPLKARIQVTVTDVDGRSVADAENVPVKHGSLWLGIKSPEQVKSGNTSQMHLLAVDAQGQRVAQTVQYRLYEEISRYQWYQQAGDWHYRRQVSNRLVSNGEVTINELSDAAVDIPGDAGRYRLDVQNSDGSVTSSKQIQVGWMASGPAGVSPDRLTLNNEKSAYRIGEVARLRVKSPFTGHGELVIANDRVLSVRSFALHQGVADLEIPVDESWGAGAYALVTAYRPDAGREKLGPRRAIGVSWLGIDKAERALQVSIDAPDKVQSRQTLPVKVTVKGSGQGQHATDNIRLTLAAVDEGVLRLTGYALPDPLAHYFGQRHLGVEVRDLYGALIDGHAGLPAAIRSGAGASGMQGAPQSHVKIVSLFSGVLKVGADNSVEVPLQLPDFNGELRLMAIAWDDKRLGNSSKALTVRDPVVVMPSMPRFMSVGDKSRASILIQHVEGALGEYELDWSVSGTIALDADDEGMPSNNSQRFELTEKSRQLIEIPIEAMQSGKGELLLKLTGPDGVRIERQLAIGVRAAYLPDTQRLMGYLAAGDKTLLDTHSLRKVLPSTAQSSLSFSTSPDLNVPGLLKELDLYPYGCLEQVTSRAFPLLDLEALQQKWQYQSKVPVDKRLAKAVKLILQKQQSAGGFGLWDAQSNTELWLSMYAIDFLSEARSRGVHVPETAWKRALEWLQEQIRYPEVHDAELLNAQAYAVYILARLGEKPLKTARYLVDQLLQMQAGSKGDNQAASKLAISQLSAGLSMMGEAERAAKASKLAKNTSRQSGYRDYGSALRDMAAAILLQAQSTGLNADGAVAVKALARKMAERRWLSTQEQAWLVRTAAALTLQDEALQLSSFNGPVAGNGPLVFENVHHTLDDAAEIHNTGKNGAWYSLTITGSPLQAPAELSEGLSISRQYFDRQGNRLDMNSLQQGQYIVVVVEAEIKTQDTDHQLLIVDPLPAGVEIENDQLSHASSVDELHWLEGLYEVDYSAALDDRFVAAMDTSAGTKNVRVAYLARAVSPGQFVQSPVTVEDMYKPYYRARGKSSQIDISRSK